MSKTIKIIILIMAGMCLLTGFVTITAASTDYLIESGHNYANNYVYTWPEISQPGATQIRLHFVKLDLSSVTGDSLLFLDKDGKELVEYTGGGPSKEDFWSAWFAGDTLKLRLQTDNINTAYGFKIDKIETRTDMAPPSVLPESYHNYANNYAYTWPEISQPGATQIRLHFVKLGLGNTYGDYLFFLDKDGNQLVKYGINSNKEDFWSEWFAGDTLKVRLKTDDINTAYGFKIDKVETRPSHGFTPAEQSEFTSIEENETPSPITAQSTDVTTEGNNTIPVTNTVTKIGEGRDPAIYGNNVVWSNNGIHLYNLNTSIDTQISLNGSYPAIYGNKIVWLDDINGSFRLSIYDISTGATSNITQNVDNSSKPSIYGDKIVYAKLADDSFGEAGVYVYDIPFATGNDTDATLEVYDNVVVGGEDMYNNGTEESGSSIYICRLPESSTELPASSSVNTSTPSSSNSSFLNTNETSYLIPCIEDACAAERNADSNKLSASFYANVTSGTAPLKVLFTSSITGNPSSYFWVFEPNTSSDWNSKHAVTALHTFRNPGVYTVSLTINNGEGSTTVTKNNYITVF